MDCQQKRCPLTEVVWLQFTIQVLKYLGVQSVTTSEGKREKDAGTPNWYTKYTDEAIIVVYSRLFWQDVVFSHKTYVADRRHTDRDTSCTCAITAITAQYGWLKTRYSGQKIEKYK